MLEKLGLKGEFSKNVVTLMAGTLAAQIFSVAVSPILSRLYTPADFGVLALFTAINAIASVVAAARYETAIMLPKEDGDALNIVALSVAITLAVGVALLGAIFIFENAIFTELNTRMVGKWVYFLPISVVLSSANQIMIYWNNRGKRFHDLAVNRTVQAASTGITQCSAGYVSSGAGGLVAGCVVGQLLSLITLTRSNMASIAVSRSAVCIEGIKLNAKKYRRFPLFSVWGALFDSGASQMPLFIIASFFSASITGLFSFTLKVLSLPLFLISSAIAQVLYQKITELDHEAPAVLRHFIIRVFLLLGCIAFLFCLFFMSFGVETFSFVFGKEWTRAGEFAGPLSIAAGVRFMVSPLSVVMNLNHNVKKAVGWQVVYFFTLTAVLLACSQQSIDFFLQVFVIHEVVLFSAYFAVIIWATYHKHEKLPDDTNSPAAGAAAVNSASAE